MQIIIVFAIPEALQPLKQVSSVQLKRDETQRAEVLIGPNIMQLIVFKFSVSS